MTRGKAAAMVRIRFWLLLAFAKILGLRRLMAPDEVLAEMMRGKPVLAQYRVLTHQQLAALVGGSCQCDDCRTDFESLGGRPLLP